MNSPNPPAKGRSIGRIRADQPLEDTARLDRLQEDHSPLL